MISLPILLFLIFFIFSHTCCSPVVGPSKELETSSKALPDAGQSSIASTQSHNTIPFGRASRRKTLQRYRGQFSKESMERKSKELQGKELSDYLARAKRFRTRRNAETTRSKKKAQLRKKDAELAKSLEAEQAAKEKKEQLAAANKAAFSQI